MDNVNKVENANKVENVENSEDVKDNPENFCETDDLSKSTTIAFGFGALTDQMSHQAFQVLVFTFYYAVVGINLTVLAWAFVIFAIWDSINDPLLGPLSDKTKSKLGRRRFWIVIVTVPFAIVNILLFTPPFTSDIANAAYMIVIIILYDLFYTIFSTNQTSLFPEMFPNEKKRAHAALYKNILTIFGVIVGSVLPTVFISPMAPTEDTPPEVVEQIPGMYMNTGIMLCVLIIIFGFLFFKFGMVERVDAVKNCEKLPKITESLKQTLKNKAFIIFVTANLFIWFGFKILTTIIPLYGIHVLGIGEGDFLLTLLLLAAFLSATCFFPVMQKLGNKVGFRKAFMISETIWIFALIPFAFLDNQPYIAIFCMIFVGIGLSGAMYFVDIIIGNVIDEDQVKTGHRRQGAFYGVNALINRYSTILVFAAIAIVLSGYGWEEYLVGAGLDYEGLKEGLKILMVVLPICSILLVLLLLKIFPLHGERLKKVKEELAKIQSNKSVESDN
jgi:glycoside/pentoside/hexuronide:cation symporter, GPH family